MCSSDLLLQSATTPLQASWVWPAILLSSLAAIVALSRAGTSLFWRVNNKSNVTTEVEPVPLLKLSGVWLLLACSPLLVIFAGSITEYTRLAAEQLFDIQTTLDLILQQGGK